MVQLRFLKKLFNKRPKAVKEPRGETLIWLPYKNKVYKVFNARTWPYFFLYPSNPSPSVDSLAHCRHKNASLITNPWLYLYLGPNITDWSVSQTPVSRYHELEVLTLQGSHHGEPEIVHFLSKSIRNEYEFLNLISHKSSLCYFPVSCHSSFPLLQSRLQSSRAYRSQEFLNLCCFIHHFNSQLIA